MTDQTDNSALPHRDRPVHQPVYEPHNRAIIVFLTVCTKDRQRVLANEALHESVRTAWTCAAHWLVGRYVIMPDHVHLFCAPGILPAKPLSNWVRHWKTSVSKAIGAREGTFWQSDFWDTQLRRHESYALKWDYVRENPVRAGLVAKPEDWPYEGELNVLRWHH
jgi:putative transposase